jgi:hypothetical protein
MKTALVSLAVSLTVLALAAPALAQDHSHAAHAAPLNEPGQGAFAAIQEVVARLGADPATDWSRVDVEGLRQHLVDMDEVTMRADIRAEPVEGGARFHVAGAGRTREAIQRMVMAHARAAGENEHWRLTAQLSESGAVVTAIGRAAADTQRIRALGLIGIMAEGAHHQPHHWAMASGANPHH